MDHEVIFTWLGLQAGSWPPDHYRLLGLEPGETDAERIEVAVQQRLELIRRYQLTNAEQATEAMNRLAQAFVCLTDAEAKKSYDDRLRAGGSSAVSPVIAEPAEDRNGSGLAPEQEMDILDVVQPRPAAKSPRPISPVAQPASGPSARLTPVPTPARTEPGTGPSAPSGIVPGPLLPDVPYLPSRSGSSSGIRKSAAAPRGWGTRRALYQRLARARQLRAAWEKAGKYVGRATARANKPHEAVEMARHMTAIRDLMEGYPSVLGESGQPGQLMAALARQQVIAPTFQSFVPSQREALARDWLAGQKLLQEQYDSLRQQLQKSRPRSGWPRSLRVAGEFLRDHPSLWLLLLALLALFLASRMGASSSEKSTEATSAEALARP